MAKKIPQKILGIIAFWFGVWLIVAALLEWGRAGFVVHYVNTRWIILLFCMTGLTYLAIKLPKQ